MTRNNLSRHPGYQSLVFSETKYISHVAGVELRVLYVFDKNCDWKNIVWLVSISDFS